MLNASYQTTPNGSANEMNVSFEFFPPKSEKMEKTLWQAIRRLEPLAPHFISVTYGAGGSTRERTHATVARILKETNLTPAAHLTCVGSSRDEIDAIIKDYWDLGVRHIVALRGDAPEGVSSYAPHPEGYANSADLVAGIKAIGDFEVSVSAYPERHPDSANLESDIDMLQAKVDAGATRAITQFFFDNDLYFRYLDRVRARGIEIPVTPGFIPILNFHQVAKFAKACGTHVPGRIAKRYEGLDDDPETRKLVAATIAAEQVSDLAVQGVKEFHFYTLNKADLVFAICHLLGLRAKAPAEEEVSQ